ncbi:TolC family protein [Ginsengibacter hankyongi]|uniref:TolC family protein n=1 Tax=Ginsengibacter hankyongi TaxID=2607284 RepID=A0A5J5IDQ7_9BACT|nr:TolC family protein [Ginsengibacter hankyongi]KAA9037151.1 TolC family protein [Ginsengibacter hankyongi]
MKNTFYAILICLGSRVAYGQDNLEKYIVYGLNNNESIRTQQFTLKKSIYALRDAKSQFFPDLSFITTYTKAGGGRSIDLPLGDLVNPIYATLNLLTQSNSFPVIKNRSVLLNPDNFYDAKFHATMPLLDLELNYNRKIKQQEVTLQQIEVDIYKRELIKEIKSSYFGYAQSEQATLIYQSALKVAEENLRINNALFRNDKVTRSTVLRSESELSKYQSLLETARQEQRSAKAYFNFLLNRAPETEIAMDNYNEPATGPALVDSTVDKREELKKLNTTLSINDQVTSLNKSYIVPKLGAFLDFGSQASDWQYGDRTRYYFAGVSLRWNLFASGKNRYRVAQSETDKEIIKSQINYTNDQLKLQLILARNAYNSSLAKYTSALKQLAASEKYYQDELKLYKQGQALFIELLDGQNQLIGAQLQLNVSLYDTWIKAADIERANAGFGLK